MTEEIKELLEEYENLCKNRDWYYHYSDDHSVWRDGQVVEARCKFIVNYLSQLGLAIKTREINDKYNPFVGEE